MQWVISGQAFICSSFSIRALGQKSLLIYYSSVPTLSLRTGYEMRLHTEVRTRHMVHFHCVEHPAMLHKLGDSGLLKEPSQAACWL